ncbi:MAG TPA: pirin family protein [Mariprofundaceae bacterium]|nr:pirin family protein [Mariprofundaceae bacterium]
MDKMRIQQALTVPEGAGVTVRRLMPVHGMLNYDPFVLWDHFDIETGGFPDHPHRGFEAITYLFAGGMKHADNLGNRGTVHAGGAQRFTAGRGLVHSEFPDGHAAGIQLWINLPARLKGLPADYQQLQAGEIPEHEENGVRIRTIVGEGSPLTLHTPVEYLEIAMSAGSTLTRDIPDGLRGFIYVVAGRVSAGERTAAAGQALLVEDTPALSLSAPEDTRLMWCFGRPHGEPIRQHGPYVD